MLYKFRNAFKSYEMQNFVTFHIWQSLKIFLKTTFSSRKNDMNEDMTPSYQKYSLNKLHDLST